MTENTIHKFKVGDKVKIRKKSGFRSFYPPEEGVVIKVNYPKVYVRNDQGQIWTIIQFQYGGNDELRLL